VAFRSFSSKAQLNDELFPIEVACRGRKYPHCDRSHRSCARSLKAEKAADCDEVGHLKCLWWIDLPLYIQEGRREWINAANTMPSQWRSQTKRSGGPKCLILGEQQYFIWDTASQSTKLLTILKIGKGMAPWAPLARPMYPPIALLEKSASNDLK